MLTYGFLADGLFSLSQTNQGSELNRYCKMEGIDYQHLVSESHSIKKLLAKRRFSRLEAANSIHLN